MVIGVYVGSDLTNRKVLSVDDVLTFGKTTVETKNLSIKMKDNLLLA